MALKVMKFGGSSVADVEKIQNVTRRVIEQYDQGHDCVVVVSAMGKMTDNLIRMANEINPKPSTREMDRLLSTGEQVSIAMIALAVQAKDRPAISLTGRQVGIKTDGIHSKARITEISTERIQNLLKDRYIIIVAGFQGMSPDDNITTLGRGGSDLTAVALAAALKADVCEIFTDVDGVYSTDPRVVKDARKLDHITYDEMLELATLGAKVLHNRAVECAKNYNVPLHVRSSFKPDTGTMVVKEVPDMEEIVISGVAFVRNEAKITVLGIPDKPGYAARVFKALAENQIVVDMIVQNVSHEGKNDIGFTVSSDDLENAVAVCTRLAKELDANDVLVNKAIAKVSVVGVGMQTHVDVAATMFDALAKADINIHSISTSEIKISVLIDEDQVDKAVQVIHEEFELADSRAVPQQKA